MKPLIATTLLLTAVLVACTTAPSTPVPVDTPPMDIKTPATTINTNPFGMAAGDTLRWLADPIPEKRAELNRQLDDMQSLGVGWVRVDFPWYAIQPRSKTEYYWSGMDVLVKSIRSRNMQVLGILDYTPQWAREAGCQSFTCPPANVADFAAYARATAARYASQGIHTWEIWNEPNLTGYWSPQPDPVRYTQLVTAATKAIKQVDPSATVIVGALGYNGVQNGNMHPVDFLKKMYQAAPKGFDAVSYHAYSYPMMPTDAASYNGWTMMDAATPSIYQVMKANGDGNKKIWITEYGAPAISQRLTSEGVTSTSNWMVTDTQQAKMMEAAIAHVEASPHIAKFFWYSYKDLGVDPSSLENFFGLTDYYGNQKPAYHTFKDLITQARQSGFLASTP